MNLIVDIIKTAKGSGNTVFVCGNGGSSANAEHFTNDLFSKGIKAHCLSSNTSILTMIANDFGYKYVFSKQLEVYGRKNDVLVVLSCSGNSKNVVEATKTAREMGMGVIGLLGYGGEVRSLTDVYDLTLSEDFGIIESKHSQLCHEISKKL